MPTDVHRKRNNNRKLQTVALSWCWWSDRNKGIHGGVTCRSISFSSQYGTMLMNGCTASFSEQKLVAGWPLGCDLRAMQSRHVRP